MCVYVYSQTCVCVWVCMCINTDGYFSNELMMTSNLWFREELCVLLFLWRNKKTMKGGGERASCMCV